MRGWVRSRLRTRPYQLFSSLPPADVAVRLANRLEPIPRSPFWYPKAGMAFIGKVEGSQCRIYVRGLGRNSWRWVFTGSIIPAADGNGSEITGELGPPARTALLSFVWLAIATLFLAFGVGGFIHGLAAGTALSGAIAVMVITAAFVTAFVLITNLGWRSAGKEWTEMERWLKTTIQARPAES